LIERGDALTPWSNDKCQLDTSLAAKKSQSADLRFDRRILPQQFLEEIRKKSCPIIVGGGESAQVRNAKYM
jgi:hypothetical protein